MRSRDTIQIAWACALALTLQFARAAQASSQTPADVRVNAISVSRDDALRLAVEHSPRTINFRADSSAAAAQFALARQFENPTLGASYSKSEPQAHFTLDVPLDWPRARQSRISAARNNVAVMSLRNMFGRRALELDVDTAYTRTQVVAARAQLSKQTARDADSLLTIARIRRDAGDASELDVELATVFAGQLANTALADSLQEIGARALLQTLMGLSLDSTQISLSETISLGAPAVLPGAATTSSMGVSPITALLPVAAAQGDVVTANLRLLAEQRRKFAAPSVSVGFETVQSGSSGPLPTLGFALPFPLFNRNSASIQLSQAELVRARANLALIKLEQTALVASADRDATAARARLARSGQLVA
ncbi:MAG: TolC family protein, partial [Gemmatimonadaceae bacterium]